MEIEFFQGRNERWYWRCRATNGRIIAAAAGGKESGYARKSGAQRAWDRFEALVCYRACFEVRPRA